MLDFYSLFSEVMTTSTSENQSAVEGNRVVSCNCFSRLETVALWIFYHTFVLAHWEDSVKSRRQLIIRMTD